MCDFNNDVGALIFKLIGLIESNIIIILKLLYLDLTKSVYHWKFIFHMKRSLHLIL